MGNIPQENRALWAVLLVCILAGTACFWQIFAGTQTAREAVLLSLLLTIASISASWVVTHFYAVNASKEKIQEIKLMHHENLRLFGLKAAEKVFNLSNEIARLEEYVTETVDERDNTDSSVALKISDERLAGIRHSLVTLRSINDRSLSDWEGVIGEELKQKQLEFKEYEEEMSELVHRIEELDSKFSNQDTLKLQLASIQKEMKSISSQLPNTYIFGGVRPPKSIKLSCPECGHEIKIRTNLRGVVHYKGVTCPSCGVDWICTPNDDFSAQLIRRKEIRETAHCPVCNHLNTFNLDNIAGGFVLINCANCNTPLNASRARAGVTTTIRNSQSAPEVSGQQLSEDFIAQVQSLLPAQPWPKNTHKEVAEKLDVPFKKVSKAIAVLIARGVFYDQRDGKVLYDPPDPSITDGLVEGGA
jgi:transcription elongation factor Elf1